MTAKGTHERIQSDEIARVFSISALRLDAADHVVEVQWAEVRGPSNLGVGAAVRARAEEVVTALHAGHRVLAVFPKTGALRPDRSFRVVELEDGTETLALDGAAAPHRELRDLAALQPRQHA